MGLFAFVCWTGLSVLCRGKKKKSLQWPDSAASSHCSGGFSLVFFFFNFSYCSDGTVGRSSVSQSSSICFSVSPLSDIPLSVLLSITFSVCYLLNQLSQRSFSGFLPFRYNAKFIFHLKNWKKCNRNPWNKQVFCWWIKEYSSLAQNLWRE